MNVFEKAIEERKVSSEDDLKRLFWKCAKRIHPDASGIEENHERFIALKDDFDEAVERFRLGGTAARGERTAGAANGGTSARTAGGPKARQPAPATAQPSAHSSSRPKAKPAMDRAACVSLFVDLLASNFPADISIRASNKTYLNRVLSLNEGLSSCDPALKDLFLAFEREMYALKGATTVSNHPFNVVKLYLYRYGDYTFMQNSTNKNFLKNGYDLVRGIFAERNMSAALAMLDWLLDDVVTRGTGERRTRAE